MTSLPKHKADAQHERFTEAARALGADEDEAAFRTKLALIAKHRPQQDAPARPAPTRRKKPNGT